MSNEDHITWYALVIRKTGAEGNLPPEKNIYFKEEAHHLTPLVAHDIFCGILHINKKYTKKWFKTTIHKQSHDDTIFCTLHHLFSSHFFTTANKPILCNANRGRGEDTS